MAKPYILKPVVPFKLDTSKPIKPQLEERGIPYNGNDYIDMSDSLKMSESHSCGCPLFIKQVFRDKKGRFTKGFTQKTVTQECTSCLQKTYIGTGND